MSTLYQQWQNIAYDETADRSQLEKFWGTYFQIEKEIYEKLLSNPDEAVKGTVKELAEKFGQEVLTMIGFLDGINESLLIEQDLDDMYLCMAENQIACVFYYKKDEDEEYGQINGKWLNDEPYAVVHRVASTGIIKGAASYCLDWAYSQIPNLRMDTYRDNIPMQKLLEKCGFQYCGSFERLGTDKWMAYHKA